MASMQSGKDPHPYFRTAEFSSHDYGVFALRSYTHRGITPTGGDRPYGRIPSSSTVLQSPLTPTLWLVGAEVKTSSDIGEHVRVVRLPRSDSDEWTSPDTIISVIPKPFRRYEFGEDMCTEYVLSRTALNHSAE